MASSRSKSLTDKRREGDTDMNDTIVKIYGYSSVEKDLLEAIL